MIQPLLLLAIFYVTLNATPLKSNYKITFGILGTLGNATTILNKSDNSYYIRMDAKTIGLAKVLSNNRQEIYESRGKVVNGILIPVEYKKTRMSDSYIKVKKFTFDHKNKKVYLENNQYYKDDQRVLNNKEQYKFYASNDILSLYFNILELIKKDSTNRMIFYAIGGKKENGRIDIERVEGKNKIEIAEFLKVNNSDTILKVTINQNIFSSKNGELLISIGKDNLCSQAVLKDVILFGDIKGSKIDSMN